MEAVLPVKGGSAAGGYIVIRSLINGKLYVGFTADIENRINKHNNGKVRSTKAYKPYELVYKEQFNDKTEARKRELYLKSGEGGSI